jgi:large subunit ribosomal protein L28
MGKFCEITGKSRLRGHRVSHANNRTKHFQQPNIQVRSLFVPELGAHFKIHVSTSGLKTLGKVGGLSRFVVSADPEKLSPRLRRLRKTLLKKGLSPFS